MGKGYIIVSEGSRGEMIPPVEVKIQTTGGERCPSREPRGDLMGIWSMINVDQKLMVDAATF